MWCGGGWGVGLNLAREIPQKSVGKRQKEGLAV